MNRAVVAAALAAVCALAPSVSEAQQVSGQIYVGPAPQQQPVYVQQQPVYGQPVYQQPYQQPVYQQPQPRVEERSHIGLIVGGAVLLGASWLIHGALISPFAGYECVSGSCGFNTNWEAFRYMGLIPIAGPWIQLAIHPNGLSNDGWGPYLIIDGLLQAGGLAMLIIGATVRERVTVYGDNEGGPSIQLGVGPGSLAMSGTF